ncbi:fimbrial protein [Klebsiella quasipneumoniae subsp. quasipneumoniae]|uniref:Fimbrial protein n=1 Tax=Klebsiella quasipneumoniae subsp. quasipneumoniae TaxID=1667327 RepID=A0AAN2CF91_9ENTR|nr:fimbrial protein [Klebsiella quasipneumoniae]MDM8041023.1 fimbrial protein [Klebsiella quasipneumoniae]MDX7606035.1 fimbrial protein [Klebsiella quasipneumoniae]BDO04517.1 fimbrial protein [Klebsiella quasipneumoniae subsp. quasipneumoniae]BDO14914.1 fimbrial protein [Klebsiella quasipneumoniae subsp. quasipneumoniae]BDO20887.1 fimbrial protein [Klebsiella quasipneumoniae subsp. quasipneumoniae]
MKKSLLSSSLVAALAISAFSVNAATTGTITFNGELTDSTCDVDINGQGADATVKLPTVSVNDLAVSGDTTGRTAFNLNLSNCVVGTQGGHSKVAAYFQPGTTVDLSTGRLRNVSGTATNVDLELLDATGSYATIKAGNTDQVSNTSYVDIQADGSAVLPYAVQYYANAQTTPGTVVSSVVYNLQYK